MLGLDKVCFVAVVRSNRARLVLTWWSSTAGGCRWLHAFDSAQGIQQVQQGLHVHSRQLFLLFKCSHSTVFDRVRPFMQIRSDSFRTFAGDSEFLSTVKEPEIIRLLNAFVLKYGTVSVSACRCAHYVAVRLIFCCYRVTDATSFTYCQGMNTICGPFLYTMSGTANPRININIFVC